MPTLDAIQPPSQHMYQNYHETPRPRKRRIWPWVVLLLILLGGGAWFGTLVLSKANQIFTNKENIFTRLTKLILSPNKPLIGEQEGQINMLLMGVGGEGHDGAYLTDTMILAQINTKNNEAVLTSIPRDFAVNLPGLGFNKINAAYAFHADPVEAAEAALASAEQVTGFDIPYYAVIDFQGFVAAVNDVGGLDVTVDQTFTDSTFPNDYPYDTKGYLAPVTFTKGDQHLDGVRALMFARSRHSPDAEEGSDFARSERQKKILVAMKEKILALNLTDLKTINNLLSDFTENFTTNLEPFELKRLSELTKNIASDKIYSFAMEPQSNIICSALVDPKTGERVPPPPEPDPEETLDTIPGETTTTAGTDDTDETGTEAEPEIIRMYVIRPCEGKELSDVHKFLKNSAVLAKLKKEGAVVEIQNSTGKVAAETPWKKLLNVNIDARFAIFRGKVAYDQTILYDNSQGSSPNTLDYLNSNYVFTTSDVSYPDSAADFVIVIGKDTL